MRACIDTSVWRQFLAFSAAVQCFILFCTGATVWVAPFPPSDAASPGLNRAGSLSFGESAFSASYSTSAAAAGGSLSFINRLGAEVLQLDDTRVSSPSTTVGSSTGDGSKATGGTGRLRVRQLILTGPGDEPQWAMAALDTFSAGASEAGWDPPLTSTCGLNSDVFLGGHCKMGSGRRAVKTYANLPPHSELELTARLHFFDDWRGESVLVELDGTTVAAFDHSWCEKVLTSACLETAVDACGHRLPDQLSRRIRFTFPHDADSVTVAFSSTLPATKSACDASFGIDDIAIAVR